MIKRSLLLLVASAFALTLLFSPGGEDAADAGVVLVGMDAMSLDMEITGNTATVIGANNTCIHADPGTQLDFDVTADNIPATNKMLAFNGTISFSGAALSIQAADINYKLGALAGSNLLNGSEPVPDNSGIWSVAAADIGSPGTTEEAGDGVLARITVEVDGSLTAGLYNMALTSGSHFNPNNDPFPATALNGGRIAVGTSTCTDPFEQGDVDCNNLVNSIDALKVLRSNASLSVAQTEPCANIGTSASPDIGNVIGNVDCSTSGVNSIDALKILRFNASLPYTQTNPCVDIGQTTQDII